LIAAHQLKGEIGWLTERVVALARCEGYDWGRIGRLLDISRQSARERFTSAPPRMPPHVVARNRYLREQREGERVLADYERGRLRPQDDDDDDPVAW
jgi:hypothetical protein